MTQWEIFYTPHTDDETIGMAGSILRARAAKRHVLVVLVTDNMPSTRGVRLFPEHDPARERREEWKRALEVLDVNDVAYWEIPEARMLAGEQHEMQSVILEKMRTLDQQYLVAHHHTVWGADDVHVEASLPTLSHVLCAEALKELHRLTPRIRASLHGVYLYSEPYFKRHAPIIHHLSAKDYALKMLALDCFKSGIGYGYASVPELIDNASGDPREFIQEVPHDTDRVH